MRIMFAIPRKSASPFRAPLLLVALGLLAVSGPAAAADRYRQYVPENSLRLRAGLFSPEADSQYFDDTFRDFTASKDDLQDGFLGIEYSRTLFPQVDLLVGGSFFQSENEFAYRDFTDSRDRDVVHTATLDISTFDLGLRIRLAPAQSPIVPYLGGGAALVSWQLTEEGDFIDFTPPPPVVFDDIFEAEGNTVGYFLVAGLEVPLSTAWVIYAEGRYVDAEDELGDDFDGFGDLDLTGQQYAVGVALRF